MSGATPKAYRLSVVILVIITYELFILALPRQQAVTIDNIMVVVAASVGAVTCGWFAARTRDWERQWRILAATGLAALAAGQSVWTAYQIDEPAQAASAYWDDLCYLVAVPVAAAALVIIARHASLPLAPATRGRERFLQELRLLLDGLLVVGSLFLLSWMTTFKSIAEQKAANQWAFVMTFWSPFADTLLITLVLLIYITRSIPRRNSRQLFLIGAGLTTIALSDLLFSYYLAGDVAYPLVADIGYFAGPFLIALAAVNSFEPARSSMHLATQRTPWPTLVAPYVPLFMAMVFLYGKVASGTTLSRLEAISAVSIFVLVALRQVVALIGVRLRQVTKAKASEITFGDAALRALDLAPLRTTPSGLQGSDSRNADDKAEEPFPVGEKQSQLPYYVLFLRDEHRKHIESLQRSANRVAVWTFAGGVLLGFLGNIVVAVFMN